MRCINYTDFWCTTHLGALPRPPTAVEMALAAEQANALNSASFPAGRHHWDRWEEGVVEAIIAKALPISHHQICHERYHEKRQLPLGCSGQKHIWGKIKAVPDVDGMLQWVCSLHQSELTFEEKEACIQIDSSLDAHDYKLVKMHGCSTHSPEHSKGYLDSC